MKFINSLIVLFHLYSPLISFFGALLGGEDTLIILILLSTQDILPITYVIIFGYLGILTADSFWFFLGKQKFLSYFKNNKHILMSYKKAIKFINKISKSNPLKSLIITKFISGTRAFTIMYLSREGLKFKRFIKYEIIIVGFWISLITLLSYLLGEGLKTILKTIKHIEILLLIILIIVLLIEIITLNIEKYFLKRD